MNKWHKIVGTVIISALAIANAWAITISIWQKSLEHGVLKSRKNHSLTASFILDAIFGYIPSFP